MRHFLSIQQIHPRAFGPVAKAHLWLALATDLSACRGILNDLHKMPCFFPMTIVFRQSEMYQLIETLRRLRMEHFRPITRPARFCVRFAAGVTPGPRNTRFRLVANQGSHAGSRRRFPSCLENFLPHQASGAIIYRKKENSMARNPVQFQKGISLNEFLSLSVYASNSRGSTPGTTGNGPTASMCRNWWPALTGQGCSPAGSRRRFPVSVYPFT